MRLIISLLLGISGAYAETHSLKYFHTASSGLPNFPEFVAVGMVDDIQINYYDSNNQRAVPKQDWMSKATEDDPEYWERNTGNYFAAQHVFKNNIELAKQRFNQSGGVHIFQWMYGCEWDEETGETEGYDQYGYDGEDFIIFDLKNLRWIAPKQQAFITKIKWDYDRARLEFLKHYYTQTCIEWLKKYVEYGKSTLKRTVPPSVSLLQKSPSSPVTCHATGFYPRGALAFWRRDGEEEVVEDVDYGEVLPNHDGTFQTSVRLTVKPEDLDSGRLECVVQVAGIQEDFVTKLERSVVKTNRPDPGNPVSSVLIIGGVLVLLLVVCIISGVVIWRKKTAQKDPSSRFSNSTGSSTLSDGTLTSLKGQEPKERLLSDSIEKNLKPEIVPVKSDDVGYDSGSTSSAE